MARPLRIATVFESRKLDRYPLNMMSYIRWLRMSEALAGRGFEVDMIVNAESGLPASNGVTYVEPGDFKPAVYDVVKACYQNGFEALEQMGGGGHPFVIGRLATVVGGECDDGVYFHGSERERLLDIQQRMRGACRLISFNSTGEENAWRSLFGPGAETCIVPTGVDAEVPPPGDNPYAGIEGPIATLIGNLRGRSKVVVREDGTSHTYTTQTELNGKWQRRINRLGGELFERGVTLCVVGPGKNDLLDRRVMRVFEPVEQGSIWDFQYYAHVGLALAQGPRQSAECSRVYNYLRTGLPVVSESPIPTNDLIRDCELGWIAPFDDPAETAALAKRAIETTWDGERAVARLVKEHSWDRRAEVYERRIRELID